MPQRKGKDGIDGRDRTFANNQGTLTETTSPTTLPLREHNARRRRAVVVPAPGKGREHHTAPHRPGGKTPDGADSLLRTYSQFPPRDPQQR